MSTGTCSTHSWNDGAEDDEGEPRMGSRVDEKLEMDDDLYGNPHPSRDRRPMSHYRARLRSQRLATTTEDIDGDESHW